MTRIAPLIVAIVAAVYCAVDCAASDRDQIRNLPKALWLVLIIVVPVLGPAGWLVFGRPRAAQPAVVAAPGAAARPAMRPRRAPMAPDDDPRFLAELERTNREIRAMEQELNLGDERPDDPAS